MAKIGEGDPRWKVQDREDGKNVNNWHWTEQDVTPWAKRRLEELFKEVVLVDEGGVLCQTSGVDKVSGETSVNTRKGKVFFFFELEIKINWKGTIKRESGNSEAKGLIHMPGISQDNEDDFEIGVSVEGSGNDSFMMKEMVRKGCGDILRKIFAQFLRELREDKAPKLPTKVEPKPAGGSKNGAPVSVNSTTTTQNEVKQTYSIATKDIQMSLDFFVPPHQIFAALTDSHMVSGFTGSGAVISKEVGSNFSLFDGNITGKQIELEEDKKIVQDWRFNSWPTGHLSRVIITLTPSGSRTRLQLIQQGVPSGDYERTEQGWKNFFWERIKLLFGFDYKMV